MSNIFMSFLHAPKDARILLFSAFLRRASFGLTNQVLAVYLESVGISKPRIGAFMSLTLIGDALMSLFLTWFSDTIGRRLVMIIGCLLMIMAGLVFTFCSGFWVLLAAAIVGVISTSGDETGPFKTVEEACISHLTPARQRSHVFAIYGFLGTLGSACGAQMCGFLVQFWSDGGWRAEKCYRAAFVVYLGFAVAKLLLAVCLSDKCEISEGSVETNSSIGSENEPLISESETANSLIGSENEPLISESENQSMLTEAGAKESTQSFGVSSQSKKHLLRLVPIFMLDSFGYGFMPPAWIVYYFQTKYSVSPSTLGALFFSTNIVDSISSVASAFTFSMFGPVKAILAAQLPSAVFFGAVPMADSYFLAASLYFLFCACATMDVVPRQILLTTIIPKEDLIKVLGIVNIAKTFARCVGPLFTGNLAQNGALFMGFYVNSACLFVADSILGWSFGHLDREILAIHA